MDYQNKTTIIKEVSDYQLNKVFGMDFKDRRKRENAIFIKCCLSALCDYGGCSVWNPI